MIFVTLGSQKFQFNRLLVKLDEMIETEIIKEEIYAQIGASDYEPKHYSYVKFMDREAFSEKMSQADIVITHGGTGAIIGAVKKDKKVIAVPRLAKFGEHVDDHQLQLLSQFENMGIICACRDVDELEKAYKEIRKKVFNKYVSNTEGIISSIEEFISKM